MTTTCSITWLSHDSKVTYNVLTDPFCFDSLYKAMASSCNLTSTGRVCTMLEYSSSASITPLVNWFWCLLERLDNCLIQELKSWSLVMTKVNALSSLQFHSPICSFPVPSSSSLSTSSSVLVGANGTILEDSCELGRDTTPWLGFRYRAMNKKKHKIENGGLLAAGELGTS